MKKMDWSIVMSDFMILVAPFFVVLLSLSLFFLWAIKSKEPYSFHTVEEELNQYDE